MIWITPGQPTLPSRLFFLWIYLFIFLMPASGTAALGPIKSQIARLMIKVIRVSLKQRQSGAGGGGGVMRRFCCSVLFRRSFWFRSIGRWVIFYFFFTRTPNPYVVLYKYHQRRCEKRFGMFCVLVDGFRTFLGGKKQQFFATCSLCRVKNVLSEVT